MEIKTIEDTDKAISILVEYTLNDKKLLKILKNCRDSAIRWLTLEKTILETLPIGGVNLDNWETGASIIYRIHDRFFYDLQKKTKLDFGFCESFIPAWREQTKYLLSNGDTDPGKNFNLCIKSGKKIITNCEGTDNDICIFLSETERKKIIKDEQYYNAFADSIKALKEAYSRI